EKMKLACVANPPAWLVVQGVSLSEYLVQLDKLDGLCARCEAELAGAPKPPTVGYHPKMRSRGGFWNFAGDAGANYPQPLHASGSPGFDVYPGFTPWP